MPKQTLRQFFALFLVLLTPFLMADMGPKPSAEFEIIYQVDPVPDLTGYALFECETPDCADPVMMEQLGPQGFDCTQESCSSISYGYWEYLFITLDFADGSSRTSNIFTKEHFNAEYEITVLEDSLNVVETGGSNKGIGRLGGFIIMLYAIPICIGLFILAVVILVIVIIIRIARKRRQETLDTGGA